jgi:2,3-bisphosphoglycerate-dependent phosphoglycerate mutase
MRKTKYFTGLCKLLLFCLLLSNFSAFAQKTKIWIVMHAETADPSATNKDPDLNMDGQNRAKELIKALKHEKIQNIYVDNQKAALQTANPLAYKVKILARVYTDSVRGLAAKIIKNFEGTNMLVVANYNNVIPLIQALGVSTPFEEISSDDHDLLFAITLHSNSDKSDLFVSHYGKAHHSTEIPQQYILESFYPSYTPPMPNH